MQTSFYAYNALILQVFCHKLFRYRPHVCSGYVKVQIKVSWIFNFCSLSTGMVLFTIVEIRFTHKKHLNHWFLSTSFQRTV